MHVTTPDFTGWMVGIFQNTHPPFPHDTWKILNGFHGGKILWVFIHNKVHGLWLYVPHYYFSIQPISNTWLWPWDQWSWLVSLFRNFIVCMFHYQILSECEVDNLARGKSTWKTNQCWVGNRIFWYLPNPIFTNNWQKVSIITFLFLKFLHWRRVSSFL